MCQTDWIQIRPDVLSGLIWVEYVCKEFEQTTLVDKDIEFGDRNQIAKENLIKIFLIRWLFVCLVCG